MDKATLLQDLAMVERHVAMGERHLAHQGGLIADIGQKGEDSALARAVLDTLVETQALHRQDRERIIEELKNLGSSGTSAPDQRIDLMIDHPTDDLLVRADRAVARSPQLMSELRERLGYARFLVHGLHTTLAIISVERAARPPATRANDVSGRTHAPAAVASIIPASGSAPPKISEPYT